MKLNPLKESELAEILKISQEGETKIKEISDLFEIRYAGRATIMAEKWRVKTSVKYKDTQKNS